MPDYISGSGYRIAPVLGVVRPGFVLDVNEEEVDAVFEVPLRFLMDPRNQAQGSRELERARNGNTTTCPISGQRIWGVTAGIIRAFYERLYS